MNHPEMACAADDSFYGDDPSKQWELYIKDCNDQQAHDEALDTRVLTEAFNSLYLAINRLEILDNCEYTDLRRDVRFIELKIWGK